MAETVLSTVGQKAHQGLPFHGNRSHLCIFLSATPIKPLLFQTLDINWTGMTNLLDIPGLR